MKNFYSLLTTILFVVLSITQVEAQRPKGMVVGKVIDGGTGTPLDYATISLFSKKDSSLVTGGITDEAGQFSIETPFGRYFGKIEFIGFGNKVVDDIQVNPQNMKVMLGNIKLGADSEVLNEIEVRAEKSEVQMSLDKRVFNVGKDLANNGGSAADILDNVPSVTVDIEGGVSLRGSENVQILIDGKPSGMVGIGDAGGLRQLPSNLIDKVEVITNPSAKYEAEGTTGIINIVLRKQKKAGINGSFDFTLGYPTNYGAAINLNYRKNKVNFFTNFGVRYRRGPGEGKYYQEFRDGDTTFITEQISERDRGGFSNSIRFGADYNINATNILTTSFMYRVSDQDNKSTLEYRDYINSLDNQTDLVIRTDDQLEDETKLEYVLTYQKLFKGKGHELVADLRHQNNIEEQVSSLVERYLNPDGTSSGENDLLQRSANDEGETRTIAKLDYTYPFSKEGKFEAGYQGSFREITNDFSVEENNDVEWIALSDFTNNFIYDENIHGFYATYGNKIKRFSYLAGARLEHTDIETVLEQTNDSNPRKYTNFFPSVFFTYDLVNDNAIQLSYSRRIQRPRFWYLNPFFSFSDRRNFFGGNPNLDPEFTDSYELGHIKYWEKGSLTSSIYYRHTTGVIERILYFNDDGTTQRRPENLSTSNSIGIEFTFSYNPAKWLRINGDANFYRNKTEGELNGIVYSSEGNTVRSRITARGTIKKKTNVQARLNYRAPRITTQGRTKAMTYLELGASRDILKKKGTLTLSINDVFNNRRRQSTYEDEFFYREDDFQWRARTFRLTMNYRLNQKKQRGRGGRRGGGGGFEGGGGGEF